MTEQEKARKAAELLTAWADGKQLQHIAYFTQLEDKIYVDYRADQMPVISSKVCEVWRIKPEPVKQWYRVALMKDDMFFCFIANGEASEHLREIDKNFVKWLTDRIYYELLNE